MLKAVEEKTRDCIVVGGGPAGLTAAIYLARFHLSVTVFDDNRSRAATIPVSHNHAGFPQGINGRALLDRMRKQAEMYGVRIEERRIGRLERVGEDFIASFDGGTMKARTVLMATGVINRRPDMDPAAHDEAVARGLLRYCPICDGYEVTDQPVGIIGRGDKGYREALFLRSYTSQVSLLAPDGNHALTAQQAASLEKLGIRVLPGPITDIRLGEDTISVGTPEGEYAFASVYPALGSDVRSDLAVGLGVDCTAEGCIRVDDHQKTSVPGLYAAGDVVIGLDQISHAMGQAGVAATAIRNHLCELDVLVR